MTANRLRQPPGRPAHLGRPGHPAPMGRSGRRLRPGRAHRGGRGLQSQAIGRPVRRGPRCRGSGPHRPARRLPARPRPARSTTAARAGRCSTGSASPSTGSAAQGRRARVGGAAAPAPLPQGLGALVAGPRQVADKARLAAALARTMRLDPAAVARSDDDEWLGELLPSSAAPWRGRRVVVCLLYTPPLFHACKAVRRARGRRRRRSGRRAGRSARRARAGGWAPARA